jgi:iron complex transport system ATP-binding protein
MSSGERVRSLIARALIARPKFLLLDEPTAGLDIVAREQVLAAIEAMFDGVTPVAERATVLIITHHTEELPSATSEVLLLNRDGVVARSGPPRDALRDDVLSQAYGATLHVESIGGRYYVRVDVAPRHALGG